MTQLIYKNQIEKDHPEAREALLTANSRLVISVANRFKNNGISLLELIHEGNLGLIRAAKRFDESCGYEFENYAIWFIRQSIIKAIMEKKNNQPTPLTKIGLLSKSQYSIIRPGHYLLREPVRKDMEFIKKYSKAVTAL